MKPQITVNGSWWKLSFFDARCLFVILQLRYHAWRWIARPLQFCPLKKISQRNCKFLKLLTIRYHAISNSVNVLWNELHPLMKMDGMDQPLEKSLVPNGNVSKHLEAGRIYSQLELTQIEGIKVDAFLDILGMLLLRSQQITWLPLQSAVVIYLCFFCYWKKISFHLEEIVYCE